jgi:hypothetical protein
MCKSVFAGVTVLNYSYVADGPNLAILLMMLVWIPVKTFTVIVPCHDFFVALSFLEQLGKSFGKTRICINK